MDAKPKEGGVGGGGGGGGWEEEGRCPCADADLGMPVVAL